MISKEEIIKKVRAVPGLPVYTIKIIRILDEPGISINDFVKIIQYDPGLTSNILRLANSAYYGCAKQINSVRDAIVFLGMKTIMRFILSLSIAPFSRKKLKFYELPSGEFWKHSVATAIGAEQLAEIINLQAPPFLFTAALLHNMGKIILDSYLILDKEWILDLAFHEHISFDQAERQILGINHADVGALLLEAWNLPQAFVETARWHHQPEKHPGDPLMARLVHLSDLLTLMLGIGVGRDGLNYHLSKEVMEELAITSSQLDYAGLKILKELEKLKDLFAMNIK